MATTYRDKIRARKEAEAAEDKRKNLPKEPTKPSPKKEKGLFDSFFNRDKAIDDAIDNEVARLRRNQSSDGSNS